MTGVRYVYWIIFRLVGWKTKQHLGSAIFRFVEGDVRDMRAVDEAVKDVEVVFHLAAITSVPYLLKIPDVTREVNVTGTINLLQASLCGDVERFVYVSTCAVYGEANYLPINEKHPTNPVSPYAESKLVAERCCREFEEVHWLKAMILRVFNAYGLKMRNDQYGGVIARFVERLRGGKLPVIYGDGMQTRDFVHVKDAVRDAQSGFRAYNRKFLEKLTLLENDMSVSVEILVNARKQGLRIQEVPATCNYSRDVKNSTHNPIRHGGSVVMSIVRLVVEERPLLFLGVPSVFSLLVGVLFGVWILQICAIERQIATNIALASIAFILIGLFAVFTAITLYAISRLMQKTNRR